jgi:Tol biopolymer transport system component
VPSNGGQPSNLTSHPASDHLPSFSRDGRWIYFSSTRDDGRFHVFKVSLSGGDAVQVTEDRGQRPEEGPDGSLYYSRDASSPTAVLRLAAGGGRPHQVLDAIVSNAWALVDGGIYYMDRPQAETRLSYLNLADGKSSMVAGGLAGITPLISATPDGRTVLFARRDHSLQDLMLVEDFR